jgi:AcrR family transcriptional regulator
MNNLTDNKENILNCALSLFSQKGYEAVSVQEIVSNAKITKPTLYYYYKSKEGVYDKLLIKYYTQLNTLIEKVSQYSANPDSYFEDIYPILVNVTTSYFTFAKENPLFYRMVLANQYMPKSSKVYDIMKKYHYIQHDLLLKMFYSMGEIHTNLKNKEQQLSFSFLGIVNTYIALFLSDEVSTLNCEKAKELVHQFMHGIYA